MTDTLFIDIWEGQTQLDVPALIANNIAGVGIRLNDMGGGHHKDKQFDLFWEQCKPLIRFPYFVYNPWVSGTANYNWLLANCPPEVKTVALDVEVVYAGMSTTLYASEVQICVNLCKQHGWKVIIYTAQWFLSRLSSWPKCDYWFAQYPYPQTYFPNIKTWDELRIALVKQTLPFNYSVIPGTLKMWQFTGDYLTLPGSTNKMDVNKFYGTLEEAKAYFREGEPMPTPVPVRKMGYLKPRYVPNGPAIIAGSDAPKPNHPTIPLGDYGQNYIKAINNNDPKVWDIFSAPNVGPSKGINDSGKLVYIPAGWSGNLVGVLAISGSWAKVDCLTLDKLDSTKYNHTMTPHVVHRMTTVNAKGGFVQYPNRPDGSPSAWNSLNDPLLTLNGELWIPLEWINLQAIVKVNSLRIRDYPSINTGVVVGGLSVGNKITVLDYLRDPYGNIWGEIGHDRWVCLMLGKTPYTDWNLQ